MVNLCDQFLYKKIGLVTSPSKSSAVIFTLRLYNLGNTFIRIQNPSDSNILLREVPEHNIKLSTYSGPSLYQKT